MCLLNPKANYKAGAQMQIKHTKTRDQKMATCIISTVTTQFVQTWQPWCDEEGGETCPHIKTQTHSLILNRIVF